MITLLIGAACTLLAPIVHGICSGNEAESRTDDSPSGDESSGECTGFYSERDESSSGERQTTLSEYGFGE